MPKDQQGSYHHQAKVWECLKQMANALGRYSSLPWDLLATGSLPEVLILTEGIAIDG